MHVCACCWFNYLFMVFVRGDCTMGALSYGIIPLIVICSGWQLREHRIRCLWYNAMQITTPPSTRRREFVILLDDSNTDGGKKWYKIEISRNNDLIIPMSIDDDIEDVVWNFICQRNYNTLTDIHISVSLLNVIQHCKTIIVKISS
jgi:hypothetical protein